MSSIATHGDIARLLTTFNVEINSLPDDLKCGECKSVLKDACQVPCGCRFCCTCINDVITRGSQFCPGGSQECSMTPLSPDHRDFRANKSISRLTAKCPLTGCSHECPLADMEDHLQVCMRKSVDCPFRDLGCQQDKLAAEEMSGHLYREIINHSEILIEMIANIRREMELLKGELVLKDEQVTHLKNEIKSTKDENKSIKDEIKSIKVEIKSFKDQNNSITDEIKSIKEENKSIKYKINSIKDENISTKHDKESMKGEIQSIKVEIKSFKDENKSITEEIKSIKYKINSIKDENISTKHDKESMKDEIRSIKDEIKSTTHKRILIINDNNSIKDRIKSINDENKSIKDQIESVKRDKKVLSDRVRQLSDKLDRETDERREINKKDNASITAITTSTESNLYALGSEMEVVIRDIQSIKCDIDSLKGQAKPTRVR